MSRFLKYERYYAEVEDRQSKIQPMTVAFFKVCPERSQLEHMYFIGKFESIDPGTTVKQLTPNDIRKFIRGIMAHEEGTEVNHYVIESAVKDI